MKITKVNSSETPESAQLLQGKQLINIDVVEVESENEEGEKVKSYNYVQLESETYEDAESVILQYRKEWVLSEFDWYDIQLKYHARNDKARAIATVDKLNTYALALSNYIISGEVAEDKPMRPQ